MPKRCAGLPCSRKNASQLTTLVRMTACRTHSLFAACALTAGLAGCAAQQLPVPAWVSVGAPQPMPTPRIDANAAPPVLLAMHFSSLSVARGHRWSADFVTGSSVASVEVRTNLFSIDAPRRGVGRFGFDLDVLDVPPIFIRKYRLRVIARNSAGLEVEQDLPFEIR
jgi:hypothetical protein